MPRVKSGWLCPTCQNDTDVFQEAGMGGARLICASGQHSWNDMIAFLDLHPRKSLAPFVPKVTQQASQESLTIALPNSVLSRLQAKYGEKLIASVASLLTVVAEEDMLIVTGSDLERILMLLGAKPKNSSELFGILFGMKEELKQLTVERERLVRQVGTQRNGTGVVVDLGEWSQKAAQKANESGVDLDAYLSNYLRSSLENDWIN